MIALIRGMFYTQRCLEAGIFRPFLPALLGFLPIEHSWFSPPDSPWRINFLFLWTHLSTKEMHWHSVCFVISSSHTSYSFCLCRIFKRKQENYWVSPYYSVSKTLFFYSMAICLLSQMVFLTPFSPSE